MKRINRNISIIFRSERLIAQRRFAVLRRQTGFMAAAGIVAGIGLIMLNAAAYLELSTMVSTSLAALIVAVVNFAIAALLVNIATRTNAENEVASVVEMRDMAMEDLEDEVNEAIVEVKTLSQNIRKVARDPLGIVAPGVLGTLASLLLKNLKK
jgi:hypothetical protein